MSILAVLTGCQQEDVGNVQNDGNLKFLSVTPGYLKNVTFNPNDSNSVNFYEAFKRLVGYKDGKTYAKTNSASEINISQELYDYLTHSFITHDKPITRAENDKTLSENPNDCVACTVAEIYCNLTGIKDYETKKKIYKQIWEIICSIKGDQGLPWGDDGIWYEKILNACFNTVKKNLRPRNYDYRLEGTISHPGQCIGIIETSKNNYHSVRLLHIDNDTKSILYYDNQNGVYEVKSLNILKGYFEVSEPLEPNFWSRFHLQQ